MYQIEKEVNTFCAQCSKIEKKKSFASMSKKSKKLKDIVVNLLIFLKISFKIYLIITKKHVLISLS